MKLIFSKSFFNLQSSATILLLRILLVFWLLAKLISYPAWTATRTFPVVPALDFLNEIPATIHLSLYYIFIILTVIIFIKPGRRIYLIAIFITEVLSCLLDIIRWQPWQYQYMFMLLTFIVYKNNDKKLYTALLIILASTYIYSGLHKINGGFLHNIWGQMILKGFCKLSFKNIYLHYSGLLLPAIEIVAGVVLFTKFKKTAAYALIWMHLFILVMLGPFGVNYNLVVWPWNVLMILFLYTLFCKDINTVFTLKFICNSNYGKILLLLWFVLPALSFFNLWDNYLSSSLYSGNSKKLSICYKYPSGYKGLEKYHSGKQNNKICTGSKVLSVSRWSFKEMNIPPYPEKWYYTKFAKKYKQMYPEDNVMFIMQSYPYKTKINIE